MNIIEEIAALDARRAALMESLGSVTWMLRNEFDSLDPAAKSTTIRSGVIVTDVPPPTK